MSITRRILESAQSGLSKLTSLVIVDDEALSNIEAAALQAELTARKAAREKSKKQPLDNPLAKQALGNAGARAARDKASRSARHACTANATSAKPSSVPQPTKHFAG